MVNDRWSYERLERGWTEKKYYAILDGKKQVIKLGDLEDTKKVVELLNKVAPRKSTRKSKAKKEASEKLVSSKKD